MTHTVFLTEEDYEDAIALRSFNTLSEDGGEYVIGLFDDEAETLHDSGVVFTACRQSGESLQVLASELVYTGGGVTIPVNPTDEKRILLSFTMSDLISAASGHGDRQLSGEQARILRENQDLIESFLDAAADRVLEAMTDAAFNVLQENGAPVKD